MKEAEKKREKLLNSNPKVNLNRRETKESKKIRDANTTTLMLIVVISVSQNYYVPCNSVEITEFHSHYKKFRESIVLLTKFLRKIGEWEY